MSLNHNSLLQQVFVVEQLGTGTTKYNKEIKCLDLDPNAITALSLPDTYLCSLYWYETARGTQVLNTRVYPNILLSLRSLRISYHYCTKYSRYIMPLPYKVQVHIFWKNA